MTCLPDYPVLIIPAYNPNEKLIFLLKELKQLLGPQSTIVVNDGSNEKSKFIFEQLEEAGYTVLHHVKNLGKGAALKTAMNYVLKNYPESLVGIITADADGQHSSQDIIKMRQKFCEAPNKLHLGVREFNQKTVPLRSRIGNNLTKLLFNILTHSEISDTQSGLRAIPIDLVKLLVLRSTTKYDFEFEMFFVAKKHQFAIEETKISTIYLEQNKDSHFNPLFDSLRIYFIFLRFCAIAIFSFFLDFSLFSLFYYYSGQPALAVFGARCISAPVNFFLNKAISFKSRKELLYSAMQYFTLVLFTVGCSFYLMIFIHYFGINLYFSKIIAEFLIFMINFFIQYFIIFTKRTQK
jgi:putative flippase GtrA